MTSHRTISLDQLHEYQDGVRGGSCTLLDVREKREYLSGHLPLAISRPLSRFELWCDELDRNRTVIVYCRTNNRSRQCARLLGSRGFPDVLVLEGGYLAWATAKR